MQQTVNNFEVFTGTSCVVINRLALRRDDEGRVTGQSLSFNRCICAPSRRSTGKHLARNRRAGLSESILALAVFLSGDPGRGQ
jgi:hypothetical protein